MQLKPLRPGYQRHPYLLGNNRQIKSNGPAFQRLMKKVQDQAQQRLDAIADEEKWLQRGQEIVKRQREITDQEKWLQRGQVLAKNQKEMAQQQQSLRRDQDLMKMIQKQRKLESEFAKNKNIMDNLGKLPLDTQATIIMYQEVDEDGVIPAGVRHRYVDIDGVRYRQITINDRVVSDKIREFANQYTLIDYLPVSQKLLDILNEDSEFADQFDKLRGYIDVIYACKIVKLADPKLKKKKNKKRKLNEKLFDPLTRKLFDEANSDKVNNRYIKYELNKQAQTFAELFKLPSGDLHKPLDNPKANSCLINAIMQTYHQAFETVKTDGTRKYKELTYDYLCNILNIENLEQDLGTTINQVLPFFDKFHLGLDVINVFSESLLRYRPLNFKDTGGDISPRVLHLLVHNNHCFVLNDNLKSLKALSAANIPTIETASLHVTDQYPLKNFTSLEKLTTSWCKSLAEIIDTIKKAETDQLKILFDDGSTHSKSEQLQILLLEIVQAKYIPDITYLDGKLMNIRFKIEERLVSITGCSSDEVGETDHDLTPENYDLFNNADQSFYEKIMKKEFMSQYSRENSDIENHYKCSPLVGSLLDNPIERKVNAIDMCKAYSSCIREIDTVPVFSYFDHYEPYKGGEIKPYSKYIVTAGFTTKKVDHILFDKDIMKCFGFVLLEAQKRGIQFHIQYVNEPSAVKKTGFQQAIDELYATQDLDNGHLKFIANKTAGVMEKRDNRNRVSLTKIFHTFTEAQYYQIKYGGTIRAIQHPIMNERTVSLFADQSRKETLTTLWIVTIEKSAVMTEGFRHIKDIIYDKMKIKLIRLVEKAAKAGLNVCGVNTDCVLVDNPRHVVEQHFKFENVLGGLKFEQGKTPHKCVLTQKHVHPFEIKPFKPNELEIKDEFNQLEFNQLFDKHNRVLLKGALPGVGKSTAVKKYPHKILFVTPTNKLASDFQKDGFSTTTVHSLLGIFAEDVELHKAKKINVSNFEVICFDEIFMLPPGIQRRIDRFIRNHPNQKFIATGDLDQLPPIGESSATPEYREKCINIVFPNQITLKICKRVQEKERATLTALKRDIFDLTIPIMSTFQKYGFRIINQMKHVTTLHNISYFRRRASQVSEYVHSHLVELPTANVVEVNGIKYFPGLSLICKNHYVHQKSRLFRNYTYKIVFIDTNKFTILNELDDTTFTLNIVHLGTLLKLDYTLTVHSIQGMTISDPLTLFDANTPYVDRNFIWTAVTRCTKLSNLTIFEHSEGEVDSLTRARIKQYFEMKCKNYEATDKAKNYKWTKGEFIDAFWFADAFEHCKGNCPVCTVPLETDLDGNNIVHSNLTADRLDNSLPHIKSNCRLLCTSCNCTRSNHY